MRVLLIGINFGDYEERIRDEMHAQGHTVDYIFDTSKHYSLFNRIFGERITGKVTKAYHADVLRHLSHGYEEIIVIVGRQLTPDFLDKLKESNPAASFTLYLWDDVARVQNYEQTKHYYDYIFSFDSVDCRNYGFIHLPLFYTKTVNDMDAEEVKYDLYSAMFNHSDRVKIAKKIIKILKANNRKVKILINLGRFDYLKKTLKKHSGNDTDIEYIPKPISKYENYKNMLRSKAILDIQFSSQIGLTMRTIECLGLERKMITTNAVVREYDFYDSNNIMIIDRENVNLDDKFFDSDYIKPDPGIFKKYSISSWVDAIINKKHNEYLASY